MAAETGSEDPATQPVSPGTLEEPEAPPPDASPAVSRGIGRLALAPAWDPHITVSIDGDAPVVLDRRRVFEVEAEVDHVLTFELATRDYQIREQGRDPGRRRPAAGNAGASGFDPAPSASRRRPSRNVPVFVRIGDEAIGWTPIRDLPVPAGTHVLSLLRNPRWQPDDRIDQKIQVNARQETTIQFDLESEPAVLIVNGRRIEHVPPQPEAAPASARLPESSAATGQTTAPTD